MFYVCFFEIPVSVASFCVLFAVDLSLVLFFMFYYVFSLKFLCLLLLPTFYVSVAATAVRSPGAGPSRSTSRRARARALARPRAGSLRVSFARFVVCFGWLFVCVCVCGDELHSTALLCAPFSRIQLSLSLSLSFCYTCIVKIHI